MSKDAVAAFLTQLNKGAAANLQAEASAQADPIAWLVETAAKQGFQFTAAEFLEVQEEALSAMSQEDLAAVVGGTLPIAGGTSTVVGGSPTVAGGTLEIAKSQSLDRIKISQICSKCAGM
jgi:hypothetical protein